jgi:hypothetical protein
MGGRSRRNRIGNLIEGNLIETVARKSGAPPDHGHLSMQDWPSR